MIRSFGRRRVAFMAIIAVVFLLNVAIYTHYRVTESTFLVLHEDDYPWAAKAPETPAQKATKYVADNKVARAFNEMGQHDTRGNFDQHALVYSSIFDSHSPTQIYASLDFSQRCDLYFSNMFADNKAWGIDLDEKYYNMFRKEQDWQDFWRNNDVKKDYIKHKEWNEEEGKKFSAKEDDRDFVEFAQKMFADMKNETANSNARLGSALSMVRVFNKCYITSDNQIEARANAELVKSQRDRFKNYLGPKERFQPTYKDKLLDQVKSCSVLEKRVYPWLSAEYPVFERWDGSILLEPPVMSKYGFPYVPTNATAFQSRNKPITKGWRSTIDRDSCFFHKFKKAMNGKGIVLSIGDHHVDDTIGLIRTFRALENRLPIQIVYFDNLSDESKQKIVKAGRDVLVDMPPSFDEIKANYSDNYLLHKNENGAGVGLIPQEIWFVNVNKAIGSKYRNKFDKFGNKFLAALFNSFAEYALVDSDTVLVKPPSWLFEQEKYQKAGAFFYKDRTASFFRPVHDGEFWKRMSPGTVEQTVFNLPVIGPHTTARSYFEGMEHYMESGVVTIDRNTHFSSVIMMLQLNLVGPTQSRSAGDKELIWLGFAMNGDEQYQFDDLAAAGIGELTIPEDSKTKDGAFRKGKEVCSNHPAHLSDVDRSLVWFNSGFQFCSKPETNYEKEFDKKIRFSFLKTLDDFTNYFTSRMKVRVAIIPPFYGKSLIKQENDEDEFKEGWNKEWNYCASYMYCAHSQIGGTKNGLSNAQVGEVITFSPDQYKVFDFLGDVWMGDY
ncbi:putative alpha-1,3-mannosyltransferase Mnn1p [Diutina catenulata]